MNINHAFVEKKSKKSVTIHAFPELRYGFQPVYTTYNSKGKPAIMAPFFNLQSDVNVLRKINPIRVGKNILGYLNEIILYINGECNLNCTHCNPQNIRLIFVQKLNIIPYYP